MSLAASSRVANRRPFTTIFKSYKVPQSLGISSVFSVSAQNYSVIEGICSSSAEGSYFGFTPADCKQELSFGAFKTVRSYCC